MAIVISGGFASGVRIQAPKFGDVRPTGVRSRRALLDSLGAHFGWNGKVVVDLFSGSGALGLEAVSRGASEVYLVDKNKTNCSFAEKNAESVKKAGGANACPNITICNTDVRNVENRLLELEGKVDFIFADPPYKDSEKYFNFLTRSTSFTAWARGSLLIWESPGGFSGKSLVSLWKIMLMRKFAGTDFLYLQTNATTVNK